MSAIEVIEDSATGSEWSVPKSHAKGWLAFCKQPYENSYWMAVSPIVPSGVIQDLARHPWPLHQTRQEAIDCATKMLSSGGKVKVFEIDLGPV